MNFATAAGTTKEKIAYQLWIAYYNRGFEAWTEYRRLDFPLLQAPSTAVDAAKGKVPVRNIYSLFDKTLNKENYEAAATAIGGDLMTTKIFWDKF
ncbi:Susd and RagB outer membrane lipoprotein [compost metagenome]